MEIHQLRYFVAVAEEGSFSRAADREHVAQPSLSQQIQKLEAEMDHRLFDRLTRSVVVTEAGKCLGKLAANGTGAEQHRTLAGDIPDGITAIAVGSGHYLALKNGKPVTSAELSQFLSASLPLLPSLFCRCWRCDCWILRAGFTASPRNLPRAAWCTR